MLLETCERPKSSCVIKSAGFLDCVPYGDFGVFVFVWYWEAFFLQHLYMFSHAVAGLVDAVLIRVAHAGDAGQVGRVKPEKGRVFGGFYDE